MKKKMQMTTYDPEETKRLVLTRSMFPGDKNMLLKELGEKILPALKNGTTKEKSKATKEFGSKSLELMRMFENESHVGLMEAFNENYRMLCREMSAAMIKEFDCQNEAERALVALAVNAYIRVLDNSRRFNNELEGSYTTPLLNTHMAMLSKQIDRANRQYIAAVMTLKQLKAPVVELNIKANTAFVSHNQQVNIQNDESNTAQ